MRAYFEDTYILLLGVEYLYYQAKSLQLPIKYYNPDTHLCLIPVSLEFKFIKSSDVNIIV